MKFLRPFPHYKQLNASDCGPTSLRMIARYYGGKRPKVRDASS
jgi:hypothetical protein